MCIWILYKISWHLATSQILGLLRPLTKSKIHLSWKPYHLVESWLDHTSHPCNMLDLSRILCNLNWWSFNNFEEPVYVPFSNKYVLWYLNLFKFYITPTVTFRNTLPLEECFKSSNKTFLSQEWYKTNIP
jgi:hypothetical protein